MKITCCPQYTIRCNAKDFVLNNSHKKVLKKVKNYMIQDRTIKLVGKPKFNKTLEDFITLDQLNCSHDLTVKLVDLSSAEFQSSMMVTFKLYQKYQTVIHKDKEDQCSIEQFKRFLVMSPLQVVCIIIDDMKCEKTFIVKIVNCLEIKAKIRSRY